MNIVYNASAGTGKTYQVTQLYCQLVLEEAIDPRNILLMTFTENAAAELRDRVSKRLLKARKQAEHNDNYEQAEQAALALTRLPSAPICTIHSYCTRLLREHAIDAGLSPGFTVISEDDRTTLLDRICRDELITHLESNPDFRTFCEGAQMIGTGSGFGTSITETVPTLINQAGSLGLSLENTEAMLPEPNFTITRIEFENICRQIKALPKITPAVKTALDIITQALDETNSVELFVERIEKLGIKKFGRGAKEISDDFWKLKESVKATVLYRERYPAAKAFSNYVQSVATHFQQRKHEIDTVDFDDLLRMAAKLLQSDNVKPTFSYIIVDEAQDTARIQYRIIESLWGDNTNLVICGDKKQGIYTWRGADPQVMPDLEAAIAERGNNKTEPLQTSYRSKAPIIETVNKLFTSVYGVDDYSETANLTPNSNFETTDEKQCIEFLAPDNLSEESTKRERVEAEMTSVAERIQLFVNGESGWQPNYRYSDDGFESVSENNNYRYSDILILLRRTTHQSTLEQALRHAGIPYTLGGKGRGLFTRQETRDVSLFLNVVTNSSDLHSLVGFLRSPWICFSDEVIATLCHDENGFSIDHLKACFKGDAAPHSDKQVQAAQEIIARYRKLPGTNLCSELVRMLIDETRFDAILSGQSRGTQRLANLRKILDWIRENERGGQVTPAATARKLAEQIANPPQVSEAAIPDPEQNAVTIMTVHGSKGLTKRVVFAPDISFRPDSDRDFAGVYLSENNELKLGVKITGADKSSVLSPGFKSARKRATAVRDHELKNLFYVAMTRARDLVVTSASAGEKPEGWLKQMQPLIDSGEIPSVPYSSINESASALNSSISATQIPKPEALTAALATIAPPPEKLKLKRLPATKLAKEAVNSSEHQTHASTEHATELGSLGHAVLEQLAHNNWQGSVEEWLEILRGDFGLDKTEAENLIERIEQTRELMIQQTTEMQKLYPELPFALHEENLLIDGTIDLLCQTSDGFAIFDYKFTEAADDAVIDQYRQQMSIYQKAAHRAFPDTLNANTQLVVVSADGPRLVPVE